MDVEIIDSLEALRELAPEWRALWRRAHATTPFQSPAWLLPWLGAFGGELCAVCCRRDRRLAALAPFLVGSGGLTLAGGGIGDYLDGIFDAPCAAEAAAAILAALAGRGHDRVFFERLPEFSPWLRVEARDWVSETTRDESCMAIRLQRGAIARSIPPHQARNLRYYHNRATQLGPMALERAGATDIKEFLDDLFRLHGTRWVERGETGVLTDAAVDRFHAAAAPELEGSGLLRLYRLRIGARVAAALYAFADRGRFYYYLSGFDPAIKTVSPGSLILGAAIEQAISEGAEEADFLRGREAYKYLWGAEDRPTYRRALARSPRAARGASQSREAAPW